MKHRATGAPLVRHVTDAIPALRRVGEAAGDALREGIARIAPGDPTPAPERPAGRAESFHFVRWIDNPDVAPMAEPDALELTTSQVQGLPRPSGAAR
ncbi:MAG: hypothetical protein HS111_28675 [Kofleriaceae bacterium]|nr:hypothetical protein [Kofleriaceae bacterium]